MMKRIAKCLIWLDLSFKWAKMSLEKILGWQEEGDTPAYWKDKHRPWFKEKSFFYEWKQMVSQKTKRTQMFQKYAKHDDSLYIYMHNLIKLCLKFEFRALSEFVPCSSLQVMKKIK